MTLTLLFFWPTTKTISLNTNTIVDCNFRPLLVNLTVVLHPATAPTLGSLSLRYPYIYWYTFLVVSCLKIHYFIWYLVSYKNQYVSYRLTLWSVIHCRGGNLQCTVWVFLNEPNPSYWWKKHTFVLMTMRAALDRLTQWSSWQSLTLNWWVFSRTALTWHLTNFRFVLEH